MNSKAADADCAPKVARDGYPFTRILGATGLYGIKVPPSGLAPPRRPVGVIET